MTSKLSVEAAEVAGGAGRHTMVELGWGVLGVTCGVCLVYQVRAVAVAATDRSSTDDGPAAVPGGTDGS